MTAPIQKHRRDDIPAVLGERVREERNRQGITRERLAEMAGVSVDVIKRVEDGMGAKIEAAYYIAVALHTPLEALLPMQEADRAARINSARLLLEELEDRAI